MRGSRFRNDNERKNAAYMGTRTHWVRVRAHTARIPNDKRRKTTTDITRPEGSNHTGHSTRHGHEFLSSGWANRSRGTHTTAHDMQAFIEAGAAKTPSRAPSFLGAYDALAESHRMYEHARQQEGRYDPSSHTSRASKDPPAPRRGSVCSVIAIQPTAPGLAGVRGGEGEKGWEGGLRGVPQ